MVGFTGGRGELACCNGWCNGREGGVVLFRVHGENDLSLKNDALITDRRLGMRVLGRMDMTSIGIFFSRMSWNVVKYGITMSSRRDEKALIRLDISRWKTGTVVTAVKAANNKCQHGCCAQLFPSLFEE
jgi:hypothetical protein